MDRPSQEDSRGASQKGEGGVSTLSGPGISTTTEISQNQSSWSIAVVENPAQRVRGPTGPRSWYSIFLGGQ